MHAPGLWKWLLPAALLVLCTILKLQVLGLPYYWDEILVYVRPAFWLADHGLYGVLPGLHPPELFFGHTPGFSFGLALAFKIFGETFLTARAYMLGLSVLQLYFLFRIGERLQGPWAGGLAIALYFFIPLAFAHSTMVVAEQGLALFATASLYFFLQGWMGPLLVASTLAALTKETSAALLVPLAAMGLWRAAQERKAFYLAYLAPLAVLLAFFSLEKITTGRYSNFPFTSTLSLGFTDWLWRALRYFLQFFAFNQGLGILCAFSLLGFLALGRRREGGRGSFALFCFLFFACSLAGVSGFTMINQRYFLPCLVVPSLFAAVGTVEILGAVPSALGLALMAYLWIPAYNGTHSAIGYGFEGNMEYVDVIGAQTEAIAYLEKYHPRKKISAIWPIDAMLDDPRYGYVKARLPVFDRGNNPEAAEVVVLAENADPSLLRKANLLRDVGFRPEVRFERKGKWVEIWTK